MEALYGHLLLAGNAYVELVARAAAEARTASAAARPREAGADANGWPEALDYRAGQRQAAVPLGP